MGAGIVVFDMDGVLVDPTETFRRALIDTVRHFSGATLTQDDIVRIKNEGGFNDDSEIALLAIREAGFDPDMTQIRAFGRALYWGDNADGYIRNERWLVEPGLLERLAARHRLAVFTGRGMPSATHTLRRFCPDVGFDPIVTHEQVENLKPAPDGLLLIRRSVPDQDMVFVGDNVDDCRSARSAGVRFVGVAAPDTPRHEETKELFVKLGAEAVLNSVNDLEGCLT